MPGSTAAVIVAPAMRATLSSLAASGTTHAPAYAERRTREGLSKPEIIRCLKRCFAREIFNALPTLVPENRSTHPLARP
jgi:hypothetical protein